MGDGRNGNGGNGTMRVYATAVTSVLAGMLLSLLAGIGTPMTRAEKDALLATVRAHDDRIVASERKDERMEATLAHAMAAIEKLERAIDKLVDRLEKHP